MKNKVMEIVNLICNTESVSCRGMDQIDLARNLMNFANIPKNAVIQEIPVNWNSMVAINFLVPKDNRYFCLFAGIGMDGNYHFELSIIGTVTDDGWFHFLQEDGREDEILPFNFFVNI